MAEKLLWKFNTLGRQRFPENLEGEHDDRGSSMFISQLNMAGTT